MSSGASVKLNDTSIPATAVVSLPVSLGDRLSTTDSEAVVRLDSFGAVITLDPHSSMKTGESGGKPFVRLLAGRLHYTLAVDSQLVIFKENQSVPRALDGVVAVTSRSNTAYYVAGAGGAAAVATTVALVKRSKTCPDGSSKDKDCGNQ